MSTEKEVRTFETEYFLEAIFLKYGYDFREYSRASLNRRIKLRMELSGFKHISEMVPELLHNPDFFELFLNDMSISVTQIFRDPFVFNTFREVVIPKLKTYSRLKIWHIGCATGEEAYSTAILLHEAGILDRSRIYATDFNRRSLNVAEKGIYALKSIEEATQNYRDSGGTRELSDYFNIGYDSGRAKGFLREKINFAHHNLMHDHAFAEMNLVFCRNVLIYFNQTLRNSVLSLISECLVQRGFLVLGDKESLDQCDVADEYFLLCPREKIFQRQLSLP